MFHELFKLEVLGSFLYMEGQGNIVKGVLILQLIVLSKVVKKGFFVPHVPVQLEMVT